MTLSSGSKKWLDKLKIYFWLALLGHILLFCSFTFVLKSPFFNAHEKLYQPYEANLPKKEFTVLPSYLYQGPVSPIMAETSAPTQDAKPDKELTKKIATEKPAKPKASDSRSATSLPAEDQVKTNREEPSSIAEANSEQPLLKLLYKATAAHLVFPKIARDFRVNGTVRVKFLVSPNGQLSNITLVKSSNFGFYDDAVIKAVSEMSPVKGVDQYLQKAKYVTAVIVFGQRD